MSSLKAFQPILIISKIFGTLTTPLNDNIFIWQTTYIILIALAYCIVNSYYAIFVMSPIFGTRAVLQATDWIRTLSGFIVSCSFFYKALMGRKSLLNIFKSLEIVDEHFKIIGITFDYKPIRNSIIVQSSIVAIVITGLGSVMLNMISTDLISERVLTLFLTSFPLYLNCFTSILFTNIVYVIYLKYKKINEFLIQIKNEFSELSLIYQVMKCYDEVNEVVMMVNDLFGLTNLMTIS